MALPPPALRAIIDNSIRQGYEPFAQRDSLFLRADGRRAVRLFTKVGEINRAGRYYFRQRAVQVPDRRFDPAQAPVVVGRRETIRLNDGTTATTRTFHGGAWRSTHLGIQYYRDRRVNYIAYIPVDNKYTHENGRVSWGRDERVASTATDLGVISVPASMTEAEQEAEVKRRVREFLDGIRTNRDGQKVINEDYYLEAILRDDWEAKLEVRREVVAAQDGQLAVAAAQRRPLQGTPWLFVDKMNHAFAEEAFEVDEGCVRHQLLALAKRAGEPIWDEGTLEAALQRAYDKLYPDESPYVDGDWKTQGITAEMAREVCREEQVPLYVSWNDTCILSFTPDTKQAGVSMVIRGDHAYFLDGPTKRLLAEVPKNKPATIVACERKATRAPESEWMDLPEHVVDLQPGIYRADQSMMHDLRVSFHKKRIVPKTKLSSATTICSLTIPFRRQKAVAKIMALPARVAECRRFCAAMSMPYYGESMPALSQRALEHLMRPPARKAITDEVIARIVERQQACAVCGDVLVHPFHIDHKIARFMGGGDGEDNLQALCVLCHIGKSATECQASVAEDNALKSRFNRETYKLYHLSPKPPQLVADLHEGSGAIANIDVRRCRYNAIMQYRGTLPVFSPTDDIKPAGLELGDYNYVDASARSHLACLPYFGPAWYGRETCEYLLHHEIVRWGDIRYTFSAAAQIPASYLQERLRIIASCWGDSEKLAMNALLGSWGKVKRYVYNCYTTRDISDVLFAGPRWVYRTPGADGLLEDVITKTEVLSYESMRPIHQICLEGERLQMARALYIIRQHCKPSAILTLHVDGIYAQLGKHTEKLRKVFEELRYSDLPKLTERFSPLRMYGLTRERPIASEELVYKFECPAKLVRPGGTLKAFEHEMHLPELTWKTVLEDEGFYERTVRPWIMTKSCRIEAPPGFGKSSLLKEIKRDLEAAGENVAVIAPYHVAARQLNCGATTAHAFVHKHVLSGTFKGVILLDEWPVISVELAACLEHCCLNGTRLILFGDPLQLRSIQPTWRGRPVSSDSLVNSRLLHHWCDSTIFELTRYRRGPDPQFANWFVANRRLDDREAVLQAARRFPPTDRKADWNLCLSHFRRRKINEEQQALEARGKSGVVRVAGELCEYDLFVGTKLIGSNNEAGVTNGALLVVDRIQDKTVALRDEETGQTVEMRIEVLGRHTRLRHAITLASCQGRTLRGLVRLWDSRSKHMTAAHIYVAASRATGPEWFEVL